MTAGLARPFRLDNWAEDDLDYLGGPFAKNLNDRRVATKEWLELSAAMPWGIDALPKPLPSAGRVVSTEPDKDDVDPDTLRNNVDRAVTGGRRAIVVDNQCWGEDSDIPTRVRKPLYDGKRAPAGVRNTMPRDTWHPSMPVQESWSDRRREGLANLLLGGETSTLPAMKWSQKRLICAVVGCDKPVAEDRKNYCSAECADDGERAAERVRTARLTVRKWPVRPVDDGYWYAQQGTPFDLGSVSVAGIGRRDISPQRWNRYQPRNKCAQALAVPCQWAERTGAPYRDITYPLAVHEDIARRRRSGNRPWPVSTLVRGTWQIGLAAPGDYLLTA